MGLRAAAVLLIAHYDRRHLDTIRKLVGVWAPPNENDTEAYARCVAEESGFGIDEPLDLHDYRCLKPILTAMIRIENGRQPYTDAHPVPLPMGNQPIRWARFQSALDCAPWGGQDQAADLTVCRAW
jgi:hypothetical protein